MQNATKYTWTISVLAIYNENEPPLKKAYKEFIKSIETVRHASKNIRFVVFFYDSCKKKAVIKESKIVHKRFKLKKCRNLGEVDIYEENHTVLKDFFKEHVAKKAIPDNEEHKHMLITWGHGAGLGFMKEEIDHEIAKILKDENIQPTKESKEIAMAIQLANDLTLNINSHGYTDIIELWLEKIFSSQALLSIKEEKRKKILALFKIINPVHLADIIREGMELDVSPCTKLELGSKVKVEAKIQIMLCLTCYVNMIETTFALMEVINVYIAPQTELPFYGYNYKELFKLINNKPGLNEREIAKNITHNYLSKYLNESILQDVKGDSTLFKIDYKRNVSFSAVYIKEYKQIADRIRDFKNFVQAEADKSPKSKEMIKEILSSARMSCLSTARGGKLDVGIIDYENFITEVLLRLERWDVSFLDYFSDTQIISDYSPGTLSRSKYVSPGRFESQSAGSYSIFFPDIPIRDVEALLMPLYKEIGKNPSSFLSLSNWDFIIDLVHSS